MRNALCIFFVVVLALSTVVVLLLTDGGYIDAETMREAHSYFPTPPGMWRVLASEERSIRQKEPAANASAFVRDMRSNGSISGLPRSFVYFDELSLGHADAPESRPCSFLPAPALINENASRRGDVVDLYRDDVAGAFLRIMRRMRYRLGVVAVLRGGALLAARRGEGRVRGDTDMDFFVILPLSVSVRLFRAVLVAELAALAEECNGSGLMKPNQSAPFQLKGARFRAHKKPETWRFRLKQTLAERVIGRGTLHAVYMRFDRIADAAALAHDPTTPVQWMTADLILVNEITLARDERFKRSFMTRNHGIDPSSLFSQNLCLAPGPTGAVATLPEEPFLTRYLTLMYGQDFWTPSSNFKASLASYSLLSDFRFPFHLFEPLITRARYWLD